MGEARGKMSGSGDFFWVLLGNWFFGTGIRMDDSMMPKNCGWNFSTRNPTVFLRGHDFSIPRSRFPKWISHRGIPGPRGDGCCDLGSQPAVDWLGATTERQVAAKGWKVEVILVAPKGNDPLEIWSPGARDLLILLFETHENYSILVCYHSFFFLFLKS